VQLTPTLQATLALTPGAGDQAPVGALITADGQSRRFCGWIELASAIEDWRHTHDVPAATETIDRRI
jgi:hypothetical protein